MINPSVLAGIEDLLHILKPARARETLGHLRAGHRVPGCTGEQLLRFPAKR